MLIDYDDKGVKKTLMAIQDNQLVESCYTMTLNEKRLLMLALSQLESKTFYSKDEIPKLTVSSELWSQYFPDEHTPYRAMRRASDRMLGRHVTLHPKTGITEKLNWFDSVKYDEHEGSVSIKLGWSIQVRVSGLLAQFTKIDLLSINKLTSLYSIRLYELLSQYLTVGKRTIKVCDYRIAMDCIERYKATKELKRWTLNPAVKELNEKSDISVKFKDVKKGRSIVAFEFSFAKKAEGDAHLQVDIEDDFIPAPKPKPRQKKAEKKPVNTLF